jgi:AcrR family transcriptional regulator
LLRAARELLRERPWSEVSVDDIARSAGISRSTFYFYFESREAVLLAIADEVESEFLLADEAWLRRVDESPYEALLRAIDASFSIWRKHGSLLRAVVDARDGDPNLVALRHDWAERFVSTFANQIERERADGHTCENSPPSRDLARMLLIMAERVHYEASARTLTPQLEERLSSTLATIWHRTIYGTAQN